MKKMKAVTLVLATTVVASMLSVYGLAKNTQSGAKPSEPAKTETAKDGVAKPGTVTLKLSHQWPQATKDSGDFRGQLAVKFADEVEKRTNGTVKVEIYPASSLAKANNQWDAIQQCHMSAWSRCA